MGNTIKEIKDELKNKFFPNFAKYMEEVRESLELMNQELEETIANIEDIQQKIQEIEDMKHDL